MPESVEKNPSRLGMYLGLTILVIVSIGLSILLGRYPGPIVTNPAGITDDALLRDIILNLRLPRILSAFLTGMVLSASGMVFQMLFRNPLVDSGFLGVSSGAAFGALMAIVFLGGTAFMVQGSAAVFACAGLALSYFIAQRIRMGGWVLRLVLSGIVVSAIYTALTGILKYIADPLKQLPDITFWMLGGLWGVAWKDLGHMAGVGLPCLALIHLMRWRLNLLALRDESAFSLSASPGRERLVLLVAAVLSTAAVVAKAGQIGWIGLIVPHIARRIFGADAQRALPASLILGGLFVLICDDVARTLLTGEIPLGILTSLCGASVFLGLLMTQSLRVGR